MKEGKYMNFLNLLNTLIIILFPLTVYKTTYNSKIRNTKLELFFIIISIILRIYTTWYPVTYHA